MQVLRIKNLWCYCKSPALTLISEYSPYSLIYGEWSTKWGRSSMMRKSGEERGKGLPGMRENEMAWGRVGIARLCLGDSWKSTPCFWIPFSSLNYVVPNSSANSYHMYYGMSTSRKIAISKFFVHSSCLGSRKVEWGKEKNIVMICRLQKDGRVKEGIKVKLRRKGRCILWIRFLPTFLSTAE